MKIIISIIYLLTSIVIIEAQELKVYKTDGSVQSFALNQIDSITFAESGGLSGEPCPGIPTVDYEGKTYNTVQIGEQCWLRENLDVGTMIQSNAAGFLQSDNGIIEKYCYDNDPANCETYGGLYEWPEAIQYSSTDEQGICPNGWHIPDFGEMDELRAIIYANASGNALKAIGQGTGFGAGTNTSGFSALLGGGRYEDGFFNYLDSRAAFWYSLTTTDGYTYFMYLYGASPDINLINISQGGGFSVRCLKD